MTVDDAILVNVFRTRIYVLLAVIAVLLLCSRRLRAGVYAWIQSIDRVGRKKLALIVFAAAFAAGFLTIYQGKSWGGDYSQYYAQARALITNSIPEWYRKNIFIITNSAEGIGSDVYPWIWPILIAPVIKIFGFNFTVLKMYEDLFFAAACAVIFLYACRFLKRKYAFLVSLFVVLNHSFLMSINTTESDIPFVFFIFLTLYLLAVYEERIKSERKRGKSTFVCGVVCGVLLFVCYETRTMGLALAAAYFAYGALEFFAAILENRKTSAQESSAFRNASHAAAGSGRTPVVFAVYRLIPLLVFLLVNIGFGYILPRSGGTYQSYFEFSLEQVSRRAQDYIGLYAQLVMSQCRPVISAISLFGAAALVILTVIGAAHRIREDLLPLLYCLITMPMLIVYDYSSARFIYPLYPLLLIMAVQGIICLVYRFHKIRRGIAVMGVLYSAALAVVFLVIAVYVQSGRYTLYQADSKEALQVYDYINRNIDDDKVIYFFKPRVLYLNTDNYTYSWRNDADHMELADYVLLSEENAYGRVEDYVNLNGKLVYQNDMFRLYQLK